MADSDSFDYGDIETATSDDADNAYAEAESMGCDAMYCEQTFSDECPDDDGKDMTLEETDGMIEDESKGDDDCAPITDDPVFDNAADIDDYSICNEINKTVNDCGLGMDGIERDINNHDEALGDEGNLEDIIVNENQDGSHIAEEQRQESEALQRECDEMQDEMSSTGSNDKEVTSDLSSVRESSNGSVIVSNKNPDGIVELDNSCSYGRAKRYEFDEEAYRMQWQRRPLETDEADKMSMAKISQNYQREPKIIGPDNQNPIHGSAGGQEYTVDSPIKKRRRYGYSKRRRYGNT